MLFFKSGVSVSSSESHLFQKCGCHRFRRSLLYVYLSVEMSHRLVIELVGEFGENLFQLRMMK